MKTKQKRRIEAQQRNERAKRSNKEQVAVLDARLGKGHGPG